MSQKDIFMLINDSICVHIYIHVFPLGFDDLYGLKFLTLRASLRVILRIFTRMTLCNQ